MNKLKSMLAVWPLAGKNIVRWRFRLLTIGVLVMLTANLSVLYQSMLISERNTGSSQAVKLQLPYDLLVRLPQGMLPKPLEELPAPLNPYDYGKGKANITNILSVPRPFSQAENVSMHLCYSPFAAWEVWGINKESYFFHWDNTNGVEDNHLQSAQIVLPAALAAQCGYRIGDTIQLAYFTDQVPFRSAEFRLVGIVNDAYDLQKPLILEDDLWRLTGNSQANGQILACSEIQLHTSGLERNMQRVYPGSELIYPSMPSERATTVIADIQAPAGWVLRLIYLFLGLGIMTIALMTFLERRKELAILKSIGLRFSQIVSLYAVEYGLVFLAGISLGYGILRLLLPQFQWSAELSHSQLFALMGQNAAITLLIFLLAVLYPILLSKAASVNQLVFARQIPLVSTKINHLLRPKAELLYRERQENVRLLQADVVDQKLDGAFLRHPGEHVRQGEGVIIQASWFGFRYREWIAPCDGIFTEYDPFTGVLVFRPDDPEAARYAYPTEILATYDRRRLAFQSGQNENTDLSGGKQ
ncbi:MAG: ABC transporter permease [Negativicutes bacterium]|nr:ABC transporter permease [Negativicutes bacterium]